MEIGTADGTGRIRKTPRLTGRASGVTCTRLLGRCGRGVIGQGVRSARFPARESASDAPHNPVRCGGQGVSMASSCGARSLFLTHHPVFPRFWRHMPLRVACLPASECGISVRYPLNAVAHGRTFPILGEPPDLLRRGYYMLS